VKDATVVLISSKRLANKMPQKMKARSQEYPDGTQVVELGEASYRQKKPLPPWRKSYRETSNTLVEKSLTPVSEPASR
jgi:hypothetical protein